LPVAPFAKLSADSVSAVDDLGTHRREGFSEGRNVYRARSLAFCARNDSEFDPRGGVREFNRYGKSVGDKSNWSGSVPVFFGCAPGKG
jgi:hypothetical protein